MHYKQNQVKHLHNKLQHKQFS